MQTNIYGGGTSSFFQTYRWHSNSNKIPFWLWSNTKHLYFRCFFGLRFWVGIYLWVTPQNGDVELWNGTLSSGQSLTVPGISKYRAIYATIQGYKRVMFLSDTQSGFCGASAQGAQLSMSRLDISGDTVTFSGMTINFNPDGSVLDTVIPECTRISGYLTKITI